MNAMITRILNECTYVCVSDAISESNPRVIDDTRARKLANDLKRCSYYETCATYGLNVERVFQDGESSFSSLFAHPTPSGSKLVDGLRTNDCPRAALITTSDKYFACLY